MSSIPLPGSERAAFRGARPVIASCADERFEVTILVRHNPSQEAAAAREAGRRAAASGKHLTLNEFDASHAAAEEDLRKVIEFVQAHGLAVVRASSRRRSVIVSGTVAQFQRAFGVSLMIYDYGGGTYRGREGPIYVPQELDGVVLAVLGLDNRPQARTCLRHLALLPNYTPAQVMRLYNFPTNATGAGQCIALIELGGGFRPEDISAYFAELGLPVPQVTAVSVDGAANLPAGDPNSADGEVMLDIEVAGVAAPAARIAVYFAPNTDQGFLDAITKAIHDTQLSPSVISISWGGPESSWTPQALGAFDAAFQEAAVLGVTICCAAGDNGSSDGDPSGQPVVDFPASSPHVLACGGTQLVGDGTQISSETVWNDGPNSATGGGVSDFFGLPDYQAGAGVPLSPNTGRAGRGVPDVAGDADPQTGYFVRVDGIVTIIGGTSAVAPLCAGLVALCNELKGGRVGFVNPKIYAPAAARAFHDVTIGDNGAYSAGIGWDACTGLGSPDGVAIAELLSGRPMEPPKQVRRIRRPMH